MITYIIRLLCLLLHPSTCLRQGGQARGFPRQVPCPGHRLLLLHVVRFIRSHGVGVCIALHLLFFIQTSATQHGCVRACATSSAGTSSTSYSTSSTRRSTTTSPTHSKPTTLPLNSEPTNNIQPSFLLTPYSFLLTPYYHSRVLLWYSKVIVDHRFNVILPPKK